MTMPVRDDLDLRNDTSSEMLALQSLEQPIVKHPIAVLRRPRTLEVVQPNVERSPRAAVPVGCTI